MSHGGYCPGNTRPLFCRDATTQTASASQPLVFLNHRHFQTQLPGANRGHITTRSGADDRHIELFVSQIRFLSETVVTQLVKLRKRRRKLTTCATVLVHFENRHYNRSPLIEPIGDLPDVLKENCSWVRRSQMFIATRSSSRF